MPRTIGFIGLGIMGLPMAKRLLDAGHRVTVYNRTASKAAPLVALGAAQAATPRDAAKGNEIVISIVTDSPDVEEVLLGKDGAVQATNFDSYPVIRMSDIPEIHTKIVATANPPSGMGEIGVMTVAPAIANAVFQLTGKRLRHLPMTAERVQAALKA